jgi:UDP-N-acetylmuramate dehydrogenase
MSAVAADHLIHRLPDVRGTYTADAPLDRSTWFRTGGPAEVLFAPLDGADLAGFLAEKPADVPVTVIGLGSNLLVRDGGVAGVVVRLGKAFATIERVEDGIFAGAGAFDRAVSEAACRAGIAGMEFLCGVPGTVGGGLRMNAGAYGGTMGDIVREATALDGRGIGHRLTNAEFGFGYRHVAVPEDWIFVDAWLGGRPDDVAAIAERMAEIRLQREDAQPIGTRTGGSTFANPPGCKAWELIDQAGCRGLTIGGAMVSEKHTNFLVNTGAASAADIEALGEEVRRRVLETSGIALEWEIRRIGNAKGAAS